MYLGVMFKPFPWKFRPWVGGWSGPGGTRWVHLVVWWWSLCDVQWWHQGVTLCRCSVCKWGYIGDNVWSFVHCIRASARDQSINMKSDFWLFWWGFVWRYGAKVMLNSLLELLFFLKKNKKHNSWASLWHHTTKQSPIKRVRNQFSYYKVGPI